MAKAIARFQRLLVDVDDAQGKTGVELARLDLLISVEDQGSQARHRAWIPDTQGERTEHHGPCDKGVEETRPHPG